MRTFASVRARGDSRRQWCEGAKGAVRLNRAIRTVGAGSGAWGPGTVVGRGGVECPICARPIEWLSPQSPFRAAPEPGFLQSRRFERDGWHGRVGHGTLA